MKEHPRMTVIRRSRKVGYGQRQEALTERLAALSPDELSAWCNRRLESAPVDTLIDLVAVCFGSKLLPGDLRRGVAA